MAIDDNDSLLTPDQQKMGIYSATKAASTFLGQPFVVARAGQWVNNNLSLAFSHSFKNIYNNEGFAGFYKRGFITTLISMGGKEAYRGYGFENFGHGIESVAFNAAADTVVGMPIDKNRTMQQTSEKPMSVIQAFRATKSGGLFKESYKGGSFYLGRQLAAHGCTVGFQRISDYVLENILYEDKSQVPLPADIAGSVSAGVCVATATNPAHKILTQMQSRIGCNQTAPQVFKDIIQKEGAKGLFKGSRVGYGLAIVGQLAYRASKGWCEEIDRERGLKTTGRQTN